MAGSSDVIPMAWPLDPETGEPMAVVFSQASELVGSGAGLPDYCNINLGPTGAMVPCKNDPAVIEETQREMQRLAQYVIGTERRAIQWSLDPSTKPQHPDEIKKELAEEAVKAEAKAEPEPVSG